MTLPPAGFWRLWAIALALIFAALALVASAHAETCRASYYARGTRTANGERFNPDGLTAAHRQHPFGALLHVGYGIRSVVVRVTDRGPALSTGRCIDLSLGAARALGMIAAGVGHVRIERLN